MECGTKTTRPNIHHVNHDPEDDRVRNLSILCQKCHRVHHIENGKSTVIPYHLQSTRGMQFAINRFDKAYSKYGGFTRLKEMADSPDTTQSDIARAFGFSREYARQKMVMFRLRGKGPTYDKNEREANMKRTRKNLYKWIIDNDMLIGEFARKTKLSEARLSRILNGWVSPTYKDMSSIKEVTGMSFDEIMDNPTEHIAKTSP
jgi:transcriptional regulator with XRE-family HTH domain